MRSHICFASSGRPHDTGATVAGADRLLTRLTIMTTARHPFVATSHPIALAHRGGGREALENSRTAFRHAASLGYQYFETDVRATVDGEVMVFHDSTLNRLTDRVGRISALPFSEVRKACIGGQDQIMTLAELFEEFPDTYLNIDVKDDHTLVPFLDLVERMKVADRICVGSFSAMRTRSLRTRLGTTAASSLTPPEVATLMAGSRLGPLARLAYLGLPAGASCAQIPISQNRIPVTTQALIDAAHKRGLAVHVWTVDDEPTMRRLLDLGVDGIVTDRPTLLKAVLEARGQWHPR